MIRPKLDWERIDWESFQDLSVHIANNRYIDCDFQNYLKKGQKQEGLDVKSFSKTDGNFICIQCKKFSNKIRPSEVEEIVDFFLKKKYSDKTSVFILATTSDFQKTDVQNKISEIQQKLWIEKSIEFICWDVYNIESVLKNYWSIVAYYFGENEADFLCLPQLDIDELNNLTPLEGFIDRSLIKENNRRSFFTENETFELIEILTKSKLSSNRICITADAYQGKSIYFQQSALLLKNSDKRIRPLLIQVKDYNIQPISDILNIRFKAWKSVPISDLVILIDGLDEAPADKFVECAKYINAFAIQYPAINIIFSCRKLFYKDYSVSSIVQGFDLYELKQLNFAEVHTYVQDRLPKSYNKFWEKIDKYDLRNLLFYPFNLTYLISKFKERVASFPSSKIELLNTFIDDSYNKSKLRQIPQGRFLKEKLQMHKKALQKFAFALQLTGTNELDEEQLREILSVEEVDLLKQSSLVTIAYKRWTFINLLFQEHLAALLLSELSVDQILLYSAIGKNIRKVKTKWIQTFSSLLSFDLEKGTFNQLLDFLKNDNLELVFQTEKSKFSSESRDFFLKELLQHCNKLEIGLSIISENTIAYFVDDSDLAINYLIDCLNSSFKVSTKIICARILRYLDLSDEQIAHFFECLKEEVLTSKQPYYLRKMLEIASKYKLGDAKIINEWINLPINNVHEFRDGIYQLTNALNLVDEFYDYGISGIDILMKKNEEVAYAGSEFSLYEFLLSTNNRFQLGKLFEKIISPEWLSFNRYKTDNFFKKLAIHLEEVYKADFLVIFQVSELLKLLLKSHLRVELQALSSFIHETDLNSLFLRILIPSLKSIDTLFVMDIGGLINSSCFDYILFEYEEDVLSVENLRRLIFGLRQSNKDGDIAKSFLQLNIDATERSIFSEDTSYQEVSKLEKIKHRNDIKYLQSLKSFSQGVEKYFKAFDKIEIDNSDLYIDYNAPSALKKISSDVIYRFLLHYSDSYDRVVRVKNYSKYLNSPEWFDWYRIQTILDYNQSSTDTNSSFKLILEEFYYRKLQNADFKNTWSQTGDNISGKTLELQLVQIFKRFEFDTAVETLMEMIWTDIDGTKSIENNSENHSSNVSKLIISKLGEDEIEVFKEKIIKHVKEGIQSQGVLGSHVSVCDYLHITEAKDLIYDIIKYNQIESGYELINCADIYLKLGGNKAHLLKIFEDISDYSNPLYLHLVVILKTDYADNIRKPLLKALSVVVTDGDTKIQIAKHLSSIGENKGFDYLVEYLKKNNEAPYTIQEGLAVHNIDTKYALKQINSLIFMMIDPKFDSPSIFHSPKHLLIEWVNGLASKSEEDLLLVEQFLIESKIRLSLDYSKNVSSFNWYINRIIENFRNSDSLNKSIKDVVKILKEIAQN